MFRNITTLIPRFNFKIISNKQLHTTFAIHNKLINSSTTNGVREIMLNDPKTRNSLSLSMMNDILEDLKNGVSDEAVRCVVISSNGPVFSAGHNLKELIPECSAEHKKVFDKCTELVMFIRKAPIPIIAKVNGLAAAAGCQLVASCDMIVCSDTSSFSTPGANFGIFCSTPGIAVSRVVPRMISSYMLLTGLPIKAQEAYTAGLVTTVVPCKELDTEVEKICTAIQSKSRAVIQLGKEFYHKQLEMSLEDAYQQGAQVMTDNLATEDGIEGIKGFVEKRKPNWKH